MSPMLIVSIVLLVILGVFCAVNTRSTKVSFVVASAKAPLFLVMLITAVLGALIGRLLQVRR